MVRTEDAESVGSTTGYRSTLALRGGCRRQAQQTGIEESRLVRAGVVWLLTARKTSDRHKQAWMARQAGLDTVAVRVRDLDDEAAADAYTGTHDQNLDNLRPLFEDRSPNR